MTDYIENRIVITGPSESVALFRDRFINAKHGCVIDFDFERIIPMPEIVRQTERFRNVELGRAALTGDGLERFLDLPEIRQENITSAEQLRAYLELTNPTTLEEAEISLAAEQQTGHYSWKSWAYAKWGATFSHYFQEHEYSPGRWAFYFCTPWTTPFELFTAIAQQHPDLRGKVVGNDNYSDFLSLFCCFESEVFLCGEITPKMDTIFTNHNPKAPAKPLEALASECWAEMDELMDNPERRKKFEADCEEAERVERESKTTQSPDIHSVIRDVPTTIDDGCSCIDEDFIESLRTPV